MEHRFRDLSPVILSLLAMAAFWPGVAGAHREYLTPRPIDAVADAEGASGKSDRLQRLRSARERIARDYGPLLRHDLPRRPLLGEAAPARTDWESLLRKAQRGQDRVDTLKIAVFRFEFENDTAGDVTTGDGRFDYSEPTDEDVIDPPPHNRAYFEAHLEANRRYWDATSSGRLHLEWTLFPEGDTTAYRLGDTADYLPEGNPDDWDFEIRGCGISRLVRDWIRHIDTEDTSFHFSDYDSYLFIHAGPDLQGDVNADTPGDIPSFNITFSFPDSTCEIDSIFVHDGPDSMLVDNVWVVPETISQDFFLGALNGTLTHEFGHQLGLPDLYNTDFFFPAVGVWDLMDSGDSQFLDLGLDTQVSGLIPGGISAWTRFYLGWDLPVVVRDRLDVDDLIPSTLPDFDGSEKRPRSVLVPISPREYYLLENRQVELDGEVFVTPFGDTLNSVADADAQTGVVLGPARVEDDGMGGEIEVPSFEYDFSLPGYGMLIWHVDERALNQQTIDVNAVNVNFLRRGLRLEEADGLPDIGNFNSFQFRGGPFDPFYRGNNDRFTPSSTPDSRSNDNAETGISVTDISEPGLLMSFRASLTPRLPGFPVVLGDSLKERRSVLVGPTVGSVAGDGSRLVAAVGSDFFADSLRASGRVFGVTLPLGSAPQWSCGVGDSLSIPCAVGDVDGIAGDEVVAIGDSGGVYVFGATGEPVGCTLMNPEQPIARLDGSFLLVPLIAADAEGIGPFIAVASDSAVHTVSGIGGAKECDVRSYPFTTAVTSNPIVVPEYGAKVWVTTDDGRLVGTDAAGSVALGPFPELAGGLVFLLWGDLDRESPGNEWVAAAQSGKIVAGYFSGGLVFPAKAGRLITGWPVDLGAEVFTYPSLGDLENDGRVEVLIAAEDARTHILGWNGARRIGWPVQLPKRIDQAEIPGETPLVADLDGEPGMEILVGIRDGRIMAYHNDGRGFPNWPYGAGEPFQYTPVVTSFPPQPGESPVLAALSVPFDGFLYGLLLRDDAPQGSIQWAGIGRDGTMAGGFGDPGEVEQSGPGALLAAAKTYAYPNPVRGRNQTVLRYRLGQAARVSMRFYDLSGELVEEVRPQDRPAGENEYTWNVKGLASGLYLCQLQVDGAGESANTLIKIAVMR